MPRVTRSNKLSYDLTKRMVSLSGHVYNSFNSLYALYQFETDISSSGNLVDLSGNSRDLQPDGTSGTDRPESPTSDSPTQPRSPSGFPLKSAVFNNALLEDKSGTASNFSFGDVSSSSDSPFSVSAWVKTDVADPTSVTHQTIAGKWLTAGSLREWFLKLSSGAPSIQLTDAGITGNSISTKSATVFATDTWYHIVATYDGSGTKEGLSIYVNGDDSVDEDYPKLLGSYGGMTGNTAAKFAIGNNDGESTSYDFQGAIAQVAVWNTELAQEEASALYELKYGISEEGSGYLNISPRLKIRDRDVATGSYPTTLRTGDRDRTGKYPIYFDDSYTPVFGKSIRDAFSLKKKYNLLGVGLLPFSKQIDESLWTFSQNTLIRQEIGVNEGGSTSRDGALVLYGESDGIGRWIQTKEKILNPNIRFDVIVGPYNQGFKRETLDAGLDLGSPNILETLKIQYSTDGSSYTTIMTISPFLFFNYFGDRNKIAIPELGFTEYKRKRAKVTLGMEDFGEAKGQPFYFRILQDFIVDPTNAIWAIGDIKIDAYNQEELSYPLLLPKNSIIANKAYSGIIASPHRSGSITATGRTKSGVSDLNFEFTPGESISFFDDTNVIFKPESIFYQQGTPSEVVPGFSSPVSSKTIITMPINCSEPTEFTFNTIETTQRGVTLTSGSMIGQCDNNNTGSSYRNKVMAYYNHTQNRWEKIAKGYGPNICDLGSSIVGSGELYGGSETTALGHLTGTYIPEAAIGFGPIGPISTGSFPFYPPQAGDEAYDVSDQKLFDHRILNTYARPIEQFGFPLAAKYHATGSQTVKARDLGIQSPFVLEKVVIDFHAKIQNASTTVSAATSGSDYHKRFQHALAFAASVAAPLNLGMVGTGQRPSSFISNPLATTLRIKIPTFFLMRQFGGRRKEFINVITTNESTNPSASPEGNGTNLSYEVPDYYVAGGKGSIETGLGTGSNAIEYGNTDRDLITYGQMSIIWSGSKSAQIPSETTWNVPFDDILSTPLVRDNLLILSLMNQSYTGSFRVEFPCRQTGKYPNMIPMKLFTTKFGNDTSLESRVHHDEIGNMMLGAQTTGGRSFGKLQTTSRALVNGFGTKDTTSDTILYLQSSSMQPPREFAGLTGPSQGLAELGTFDKLSPYIILPDDDLVLGFQYPITPEPVYSSPIPSDGESKYAMELFGPGKVHLIGSLVKEGKEFHETMNQNLSSPAIHEIIGAETPKDRFQIAERSELEGTFLDDVPLTTNFFPYQRIGAQVESANQMLGRGLMLALTTFVFQNKPWTAAQPTGFSQRVSWTENQLYTPHEAYVAHGDIIEIPKNSSTGAGALFESVWANGFSAGQGYPGDSGNDRIPFWGGDLLDMIVDAIFVQTTHNPSYWHAFNLYAAMVSPEAQAQGIIGIIPPIPIPPVDTNPTAGPGYTFFTIGVLGDETVEGQQVKIYPQGTLYADLDSDTKRVFGTLSGHTEEDNTGDSIDKIAPTAGGTAGVIPNFTDHGFEVYPFTGLGASLRGSVERFMPATDELRVYLDSLRGPGYFIKDTDANASSPTIGTMQTSKLFSGPMAKSPKFYFDKSHFGHYSDLVEPGKDGRTISFSKKGRKIGLALGPAVSTIFVTGSVSDSSLLKSYTRTTPTFSSNKTRNALLNYWHVDIPPEATDGAGPYGSGSIAGS